MLHMQSNFNIKTAGSRHRISNDAMNFAQHDVYSCINILKLFRAACVRCHGTKCPLLTAFVLSLLSTRVTFLRRGCPIVLKFCMGYRKY